MPAGFPGFRMFSIPSSRVLLLSWLPWAPSAMCRIGLTVNIICFGIISLSLLSAPVVITASTVSAWVSALHMSTMEFKSSVHAPTVSRSRENSFASLFRQLLTIRSRYFSDGNGSSERTAFPSGRPVPGMYGPPVYLKHQAVPRVMMTLLQSRKKNACFVEFPVGVFQKFLHGRSCI